MDTAFLITAFVTFFVIIDPIGLAPVFAALTQGMPAKLRRGVAMRASVASVVILLLFAVAGEAVLGFIGISMPAFQIAGGILLFLTALQMLFEQRQNRRNDRTEEEFPDPSIFPLALPLMAGPGAIATMILLIGQTQDVIGFATVILAMVGVVLVALLLFFAAPLIERILGKTGTMVVSRLLGMLLAALSVQFVLDGLRSFGFVA